MEASVVVGSSHIQFIRKKCARRYGVLHFQLDWHLQLFCRVGVLCPVWQSSRIVAPPADTHQGRRVDVFGGVLENVYFCMRHTKIVLVMHAVGKLPFATVCVLFAATSVLLSSCGREPRPVPPVMEEAKLVDFLEEAYLLEGYYAFVSHYRFDTLQPEMVASYDALFGKYGITQEVFDTTIRWYVEHRDIYARVCDSVLTRLQMAE